MRRATNDEPTSEYSGSKLHRFLVEYLSRPDVKGLYIIAHSMGSRTTTTALTDSSISLNEIAMILGYSDQSVFTRAFKQWSGVAPLNWRKTKMLI